VSCAVPLVRTSPTCDMAGCLPAETCGDLMLLTTRARGGGGACGWWPRLVGWRACPGPRCLAPGSGGRRLRARRIPGEPRKLRTLAQARACLEASVKPLPPCRSWLDSDRVVDEPAPGRGSVRSAGLCSPPLSGRALGGGAGAAALDRVESVTHTGPTQKSLSAADLVQPGGALAWGPTARWASRDSFSVRAAGPLLELQEAE
jgi:hypothetical protein